MRSTYGISKMGLSLSSFIYGPVTVGAGQQSTVFNGMSSITVGGGVGGTRTFSGVVAGLVADGVRVLDLAAAGDPAVDDDEDACVLPDAGSGDDLITPVYVPSTRRPPLRGGHK
ncbi:Neurexin-1a-alpha, partial [Operophtera brumata]